MQALILDAEARTARLQTTAIPTAQAGEVLVQVQAISLNPIDPLYVREPLASSGRVIGSDFAGIVSSLGPGLPPTSTIRIGDRVAGFLQGACSRNERPGAFAEHLVVPHDLLFHIPASVSVEAASGVSLVALTAAQGLWYRLGLQAPFPYDREKVLVEHPEWRGRHGSAADRSSSLNLFIYGASTSVALFAAQMAHLSARASGKTLKLFGAASKSRWDMLRAAPYNYNHLVDYRDLDWAAQVVRLSNGAKMHYVYDCISEGSTVETVASTLANDGQMAVVRSRQGKAWTAANLPVEPIYGAVWEGLGEDVQYAGMTLPQSPAARDFAVRFYQYVGKVLGDDLNPVPIRVMPGGLERVVDDGFALLGAGSMDDRDHRRTEDYMKPVSAEKVVYRIS